MTLTPKKPVNYLNNKDILKEIHSSKNSYCTFIKPEYHQYDIIIDYEDNTDLAKSLECASDHIEKAQANRASRLSIETGTKILPQDIPVSDLVFRVMTWDHIPIAPKQPRKSTKRKSAREIFEFESDPDEAFDDLEPGIPATEINDMVHVRLNFPPFQHFKLSPTNTFICVGKSHWTGDLVSGNFSKDHGCITDKLARMHLMLCEKYALRWNWRNYTYNDEFKGAAILQLTYVGLRFNEARGDNPFAYYTMVIDNSFRRVLNSERKNQNIRDDILEMNGLNPSWTRQFSSQNHGPSDE